MVQSLDALKERFINRLRSDRTALDAISKDRIVTSDVQRRELARLAHGIAGAGGSFGFEHLSIRASQMEDALHADASDIAEREALSSLIREMDVVIADLPSPTRA